ncbi:transmembrane protein 132C [Salminus brasiliensis]|uniref:transmembrane protein 132C n=1 Tax=Salminus brasiliensis TaxID=930266 RepID=UPI003B838C3E
MGVIGLFSVRCSSFTMKLIILCWSLVLSQTQPPLSLSLPARITVSPPWHSLPLSQADLGLLFTNSSPFSFTQSLLLMPPLGAASKPGLRAAFGPYSVTQLVSEPIAPLSAPLVAYLLSKTVVREREAGRGERLKVRVLFHMRGDTNRGTCVILHAFKQTEEQKASCITQPPLGLCVVTMTFPKDWFEPDQTVHLHQSSQTFRQRHPHRVRAHNHSRRQQIFSAALRAKPGALTQMVQLYYSFFGTVTNFKSSPPRCVEDKVQQSQRTLFYIGPVTLEDKAIKSNKTKQGFSCIDSFEEEELWLNSDVLIRHYKGPVRAGRPVGISINLRSNFSGESVIVRFKVKKGLLSLQAQPAINSDLWTVKVERTSGSKHETISVISHRTGAVQDTHGSAALRQMVCLSVEGLRRSFGVAMTVAVSWWVEFSMRTSLVSPHGAVMSFLSFTDREIVGIAPITESNTIINTAILTSQPVSLPVIVLGVGHDGKVSDITAAVKCRSTNEDIVKVSNDCTALFVDGSESGMGSTCVEVEFSLGTLRGSLCMAVWAPMVPLRISLSDSVLSPISGWSYYTESGCSPVYQRSTIQILAQFSAQPVGPGGQPTYMLGSPDWFVDVTNLVRDWLRIDNPRVAALDNQNHLIGLEPGLTSLHVISSQWDGVLGSVDVFVTSEPVDPGDLSVQLVGGLGLSINPNPSHPSVVTATVTSHNTLYNHGQEASVSVWLQFADDTAILASAFSGVPFSLRLSSLAESVVVVTPSPSQRILAQGDGGGPLVKAELLVSTCELVSNRIEMDGDREGGGTRRLAKGSGWIRVNLDADIWPLGSEVEDFEMIDASDMLVESDKEVYGNSEEEQRTLNSTQVYDVYAGNGVIDMARNDLERAVLTPNHEESAVYFSPGVEKESTEGKTTSRELEVGVGAVLSLLCLSSLLFLVNCLPCALRDHKRQMEQEIDGEEDCTEEHEEQEKTLQRRQEMVMFDDENGEINCVKSQV